MATQGLAILQPRLVIIFMKAIYTFWTTPALSTGPDFSGERSSFTIPDAKMWALSGICCAI